AGASVVLRTDHRTGHFAGPEGGRRPGPAAGSGSPGGDVRSCLRRPARGRLPALRGVELGAAGIRVRAKPRLLGGAAVPGPACRRAFVPRRPPLVERAATAAVRGGGRTRAPSGRRPGAPHPGRSPT